MVEDQFTIVMWVLCHPGVIIKPKTLSSILDQAGLTADELRALLCYSRARHP